MTPQNLNFMPEIEISIQDQGWIDAFSNIKELAQPIIAATLLASATQLKDFPKDIHVSLCLTNDAHIQTLNNEHRGKDSPTNVLSFPLVDWDDKGNVQMAANTGACLGDIVIALETITNEARAQNKTIKDHLSHMLVHSTLHLLGHDHEINSQAKQMESLEIQILHTMNIKNPYEVCT